MPYCSTSASILTAMSELVVEFLGRDHGALLRISSHEGRGRVAARDRSDHEARWAPPFFVDIHAGELPGRNEMMASRDGEAGRIRLIDCWDGCRPTSILPPEQLATASAILPRPRSCSGGVSRPLRDVWTCRGDLLAERTPKLAPRSDPAVLIQGEMTKCGSLLTPPPPR